MRGRTGCWSSSLIERRLRASPDSDRRPNDWFRDSIDDVASCGREKLVGVRHLERVFERQGRSRYSTASTGQAFSLGWLVTCHGWLFFLGPPEALLDCHGCGPGFFAFRSPSMVLAGTAFGRRGYCLLVRFVARSSGGADRIFSAGPTCVARITGPIFTGGWHERPFGWAAAVVVGRRCRSRNCLLISCELSQHCSGLPQNASACRMASAHVCIVAGGTFIVTIVGTNRVA